MYIYIYIYIYSLNIEKISLRMFNGSPTITINFNIKQFVVTKSVHI